MDQQLKTFHGSCALDVALSRLVIQTSMMALVPHSNRPWMERSPFSTAVVWGGDNGIVATGGLMGCCGMVGLGKLGWTAWMGLPRGMVAAGKSDKASRQ